jgi:hypothetical protein
MGASSRGLRGHTQTHSHILAQRPTSSTSNSNANALETKQATGFWLKVHINTHCERYLLLQQHTDSKLWKPLHDLPYVSHVGRGVSKANRQTCSSTKRAHLTAPVLSPPARNAAHCIVCKQAKHPQTTGQPGVRRWQATSVIILK